MRSYFKNIFNINMLFKNSYYSYFFLVFVFLFLCFVSLFFSWDPLTKNFIYLFTVLLLPIFDYMIDVIKKEFDMTVFKVDSLTLLKYIFLLCVWSFLYSKWYTTPTLLTLMITKGGRYSIYLCLLFPYYLSTNSSISVLSHKIFPKWTKIILSSLYKHVWMLCSKKI